MHLPNFMKFHDCLFKILKNQNATDGQTMDGQRETVYAPTNSLRGVGWDGV